MRVLVAPDKFKHALSARAAAEAISLGIQAAIPHAEIDRCPMADGGEGTAEILATCQPKIQRSDSYQRLTATVLDPLGRDTQAVWWWCASERRAILELASASGLQLLKPGERNPMRTSTYGTGQLICIALDRGASEIFLAVGGSATVDGGAGILQALGWGFADATGRIMPAPITGADLARVQALRSPYPAPHISLTVLADVDNPLLGPCGSARAYGHQKGASPSDVAELENALVHWSELLSRRNPQPAIDFQRTPFLGAAGGVPAGLTLELGANVQQGFDAVSAACDFQSRLSRADLCITGEGQLDRQTLSGKVVASVARAANRANVSCVAVVGRIGASAREAPRLVRQMGLHGAYCIADSKMPLEQALAETGRNLQRVAAQVAYAFIMDQRGK